MIYQNDKNENTQNQFSKESMMSKPDAAVLLIQRALQSGIKADYLLMLWRCEKYFGSLVVTTKTGIPVKIVFVRNRNKKSECLYLLSTDVSFSDTEIVRIYGNRWSIECFFRSSKSFLKLGTEFQSHHYGAMVSHTTIVFTRYIILEWIRRNQNDQKTYGELFFLFCDDIQDMDLTSALQSLMALFV